MVNLVTSSDFVYPYSIVNEGVALQTRLNNIIATYQPTILKEILGDLEYYNFENDFVGSSPQSTIWLNFLNGTTWDVSVNGATITVSFAGIKPVLAKQLYYYYNLSVLTTKMQSGEGKITFQNSEQVAPNELIIQAWNDSLLDIGQDSNDSLNENEEYLGTVYNYLDRNSTSFPNWVFSKQRRQNILSI